MKRHSLTLLAFGALTTSNLLAGMIGTTECFATSGEIQDQCTVIRGEARSTGADFAWQGILPAALAPGDSAEAGDGDIDSAPTSVVTPVPEPATMLLIGIGLLAVPIGYKRLKKRQSLSR